jgi:prepilin-type N-terminal cleavage/methylation domain-containing protein
MRFSKNKIAAIRGFTLLELVVASAVSLTILSVALGVLSEQRRWILGNSTRANSNDSLRLISDLVGQDIKQAGERLDQNTTIPGITIIPGATATDPDTLILHRQLISQILPVCQNIAAGSSNTSIDVSLVTLSSVTNCTYSYPSSPAPTEPSPTLTALKPTDSLRAFRNYRCTLDGYASNATTDPCARSVNTASCQQTGGTDQECGWAYIDDPVNRRGEFFVYSYENSGNCVTTFTGITNPQCQKIYRADGKSWQYSYAYTPTTLRTNQPQIYILEERKYSTATDPSNVSTDNPKAYFLQLSINRLPAQNIANQISNFQVWGKVASTFVTPTGFSWGCAQGGASGPNPTMPSQWYCSSFNVTGTNASQFLADWQTLQGVRINLTGIKPNQQLLSDPNSANSLLSLSSEFFPRNINSNSN